MFPPFKHLLFGHWRMPVQGDRPLAAQETVIEPRPALDASWSFSFPCILPRPDSYHPAANCTSVTTSIESTVTELGIAKEVVIAVGDMPCHKAGDRTSQMDRKAKKPLMEKRRRARINKCLGDLKNLLLEHLKRDPSQTSKLEKADILEMTVHLLRRMQQDQLMRASIVQPSVRDRFLDGWRDCAAQVSHYAETVDGMPACMKESLQRYLAERYRTLHHTLPMAATSLGCLPPVQSVHDPRQRPQMTPSVFPPNGLIPGPNGPRLLFPTLCPPALNPSTLAASTSGQPWHPVTVPPAAYQHLQHQHQRGTMPHFSTAILGQSRSIEETESLIKRELDKGPKYDQSVLHTPTVTSDRQSSSPPSREMNDTPACFEDADDDSASCSSSDATDHSESPVHAAVKDSVWRPW